MITEMPMELVEIGAAVYYTAIASYTSARVE